MSCRFCAPLCFASTPPASPALPACAASLPLLPLLVPAAACVDVSLSDSPHLNACIRPSSSSVKSDVLMPRCVSSAAVLPLPVNPCMSSPRLAACGSCRAVAPALALALSPAPTPAAAPLLSLLLGDASEPAAAAWLGLRASAADPALPSAPEPAFEEALALPPAAAPAASADNSMALAAGSFAVVDLPASNVELATSTEAFMAADVLFMLAVVLVAM